MISNLTATAATQALYANAYPEKPMRNLELTNVRIEAQKPGRIANAADWTMTGVVVATPTGSQVELQQSQAVQLPRVEKLLP